MRSGEDHGPDIHQKGRRRDEGTHRRDGGGAQGAQARHGHLPLHIHTFPEGVFGPSGISFRLHHLRRFRFRERRQGMHQGPGPRRQGLQAARGPRAHLHGQEQPRDGRGLPLQPHAGYERHPREEA